MSNLFQCNLLNPKQLYFNTVGNAFSNGFYLSGTNQLAVCTNGSAIANWDANGTYECETIVPHTTAAFDLGSNSLQWNNGFIVNAWTVSDVNKKSNITPLSSMVPDATKVVKQLKPIAFHYNHEKKGNTYKHSHIGFSAQDVMAVANANIPTLPNSDSHGMYSTDAKGENCSINYNQIIPLLVQTIQELEARLQILENGEVNDNNKRQK